MFCIHDYDVATLLLINLILLMKLVFVVICEDVLASVCHSHISL